ncbi:hypothetical protein [Microbulbifer sp. ZKSA002]|uniref:hypothetical protein n=1 Tax=Microbulbifer sp. ZKSA002 TaxID=3243388 RepID=UPI004038FFA7
MRRRNKKQQHVVKQVRESSKNPRPIPEKPEVPVRSVSSPEREELPPAPEVDDGLDEEEGPSIDDLRAAANMRVRILAPNGQLMIDVSPLEAVYMGRMRGYKGLSDLEFQLSEGQKIENKVH